MTEHEIVHVATAPSHTLEANLVEKVAAIVGKDLYRTRLLLSGEIPRIITHHDTMQMAELTAQKLRDLGLVAFACRDSELRQPSRAYRAQTLRFAERAIHFSDKGGQVRIMDSTNTSLVIKGRIQAYTETKAVTTKRKFSLPATVLTGGIPIWRTVKEDTTDKSIQNECFVRLYDRISADAAVEVLQYDLDYSFLGVKMVLSSLGNLNIVVMRIRDTLPQAVFDDRLMKPFRLDISSATPKENIEINCKLIYLCHRVMSNLNPHL
ncbi:MAG: hypothetical protein FJ012_00345 [Chloroflexi bacterium]|nr:hypothetical protein [Chloroflexota bacterium]